MMVYLPGIDVFCEISFLVVHLKRSFAARTLSIFFKYIILHIIKLESDPLHIIENKKESDVIATLLGNYIKAKEFD